jgi:hypothetical protein
MRSSSPASSDATTLATREPSERGLTVFCVSNIISASQTRGARYKLNHLSSRVPPILEQWARRLAKVLGVPALFGIVITGSFKLIRIK